MAVARAVPVTIPHAPATGVPVTAVDVPLASAAVAPPTAVTNGRPIGGPGSPAVPMGATAIAPMKPRRTGHAVVVVTVAGPGPGPSGRMVGIGRGLAAVIVVIAAVRVPGPAVVTRVQAAMATDVRSVPVTDPRAPFLETTTGVPRARFTPTIHNCRLISTCPRCRGRSRPSSGDFLRIWPRRSVVIC